MYEGASPNPSNKNFLNMPAGDGELQLSDQPTHILKVFAEGGPGEGVFFKKPLPPGNLTRSKAHPYQGPCSQGLRVPMVGTIEAYPGAGNGFGKTRNENRDFRRRLPVTECNYTASLSLT